MVAVVLAILLWPLMNRNPLNTLSVPPKYKQTKAQSSRFAAEKAHPHSTYGCKLPHQVHQALIRDARGRVATPCAVLPHSIEIPSRSLCHHEARFGRIGRRPLTVRSGSAPRHALS